MWKTKLIFLFNCLSIFSLPCTLSLDDATLCSQDGCLCTTSTVGCIGKHFKRVPVIPHTVKILKLSNCSIEHFSLQHLPLFLKKVTFLDLRFTSFDDFGPTQPSDITLLKIDGCCGEKFPNISNFVHLQTLDYNVRCRSNASISISGELTKHLASRTVPRDMKINDSCVSSIAPAALKRFLSFKSLNLSYNMLSELTMENDTSSMKIGILDVSNNRLLKQLNLGKLKVDSLFISGTSIQIPSIGVDSGTLTTIQYSGINGKSYVPAICPLYPKINTIIANGNAHVEMPSKFACGVLEILSMSSSNVVEIPDLLGTQTYKFTAEHNLITRLDFSKLPLTTQYIELSYNQITEISVADCEKIRGLRHIHLEKNKLKRINFQVLKCLSTKKTDLELVIADNPMDNIFDLFNETMVNSSVQLKMLNMSFIKKIQERGILPQSLLRVFYTIEKIDFSKNGLTSLSRTTAALRSSAGMQHRIVFLYLSKNLFRDVPFGVFFDFELLRFLDLSENDISSIHSNAFFGLSSLSSVNLEKNKLSMISGWLDRISLSTRIHLTGNMFDCSCQTAKLLKNNASSGTKYRLDSSKVSGLTCFTPQVVESFPISLALTTKYDVLCPKPIDKPEPIPSAAINPAILPIVFGVVAGLLLICLVTTIFIIITKKRKNSHSYQFVQKSPKHSTVSFV